MIDTIVFDIGQVLAQFRWQEYLKELGFEEDIQKQVADATVLSKWWSEVDRGLEKMEFEAAMIADHPELAEELLLFFEKIEAIITTYPYAEPLLKRLKEQGYKIYLLSNFGNFYFHQNLPKFTFRKYVDGELISYQIRSIKPEPMIYETLLTRFHLNPEQIAFLDDNPKNVEAARKIGMNGIVFENLEQALEELKKFGVEVDVTDILGNK